MKHPQVAQTLDMANPESAVSIIDIVYNKAV